MELPKPYIFTLESPMVVYKGRLFQAFDNNNINNANLDSNYLQIGSENYSLEELANPIEFEELYFEHNKELIENYQSSYLTSTLNTGFLSKKTIEDKLNQNLTLQLLIKEILPVITSTRVDNQFEAALNNKRYANQTEFSDMLESRKARISTSRSSSSVSINSSANELALNARTSAIRNINREYSSYIIKPRNASNTEFNLSRALNITSTEMNYLNDSSIFNMELTGGSNFMRLDDSIYMLLTYSEFFKGFRPDRDINRAYYSTLTRLSDYKKPTEIEENLRQNHDKISRNVLSKIINKVKGTKIFIDNKFFVPLYVEQTQKIIRDYKKLHEKKIKIDAVHHHEFQSAALESIEREKNQLEQLVNANSFELNGAGFEIRSSDYYAFITTPEYVLKKPGSNIYYKFPSAKIGVMIKKAHGNAVSIGGPRVLNNYKHPFLSSNGSDQSICMGDYNTENARKLPPGQAVLTLLTKAQENLLMGYKSGKNPYHKLDDDYFGDRRITRAEYKRQKLVCLNDFGGR